jgi:hypothetical protein
VGGTALVASGLVASTFTVMGQIPAPRALSDRAVRIDLPEPEARVDANHPAPT